MMSCVITGHLIASLRVQEEFHTAYHAEYLKEGWGEVRKLNFMGAEASLEETLEVAPAQYARRLWQLNKMGAWMMVKSSTVNGTELGAQEW